jgi:hypothetical protein
MQKIWSVVKTTITFKGNKIRSVFYSKLSEYTPVVYIEDIDSEEHNWPYSNETLHSWDVEQMEGIWTISSRSKSLHIFPLADGSELISNSKQDLQISPPKVEGIKGEKLRLKGEEEEKANPQWWKARSKIMAKSVHSNASDTHSDMAGGGITQKWKLLICILVE